MDLHVFVRGVDDATSIRQHAEEKFLAAFERHADRILSATARIEDETGPTHKGNDKVCELELHTRQGDVRVREVGDDLTAVVDVALDRARAALGKHIGRHKRGVAQG